MTVIRIDAALVRRAIELDEPGPVALADDGLVDGAHTPLRDAQQHAVQRLRQWAAHPQADVRLGSASGLDMLNCFELPDRIDASGTPPLVVATETVLDRDAGSPVGVPLRAHLLAMAERCGWTLDRTLDLRLPFRGFRERWVAAAERHRVVLTREGFDVDSSLAEARRRLDALAAGRVQAEAYCFHREPAVAGRLVRVHDRRSDAMRRLFEAVFGHSMSAAHWQWKYGQGRGQAVGLIESGELVAHYGGLSRDLLVFGKPTMGCQVCDVMVTPRANRSLMRRGPMQRVASTFLETQIGHALPHQVGFGFPSLRHHRLAERLDLYVDVDSMLQLRWPAAPSPHAGRWRIEPLGLQHGQLAAAWRRQVDDLWRAMAGAMTDVTLGVRDCAWLQWRYLEHPLVRYRVVLVRGRWLRRPLGVLVLREQDTAVDLLDLLAHPRDFGALIDIARSCAATLGKRELRAWITRSQQHRLASAEGATATVDDLEIQVPANVHTPGPDPSLFENRWFLMGGDADFT